MNQIIPAGPINPAREQPPPDRPAALNVEWCAEKASEALQYLAVHYPESSGSEALHPFQDAAHAAAVEGDEAAYLESLRAFMRAGRDEALRIRERAA